MRISLNAVDEDMYSKVHGTNPADFKKVLDNTFDAVSVKMTKSLDVTIGVQFVLYNNNADLNSANLIQKHSSNVQMDLDCVARIAQ
jgi:hypothetical protein